ncbi:AEC family transporter [Sulfurimonas marina]|uniref:AEC family transporter n=1 Tax=Sulfurimonas marina TaxID=2590551 RepID=A0A7M1AUC9_9BACT|nr:AEC family transporter [Sulfurimonas marina]QOP41019.1 AEC family transporter [Sulfurimonas marina]
MENFLYIVLMMFLGYFFKRVNIFERDVATSLNQFVIYISLPALILLQISQLTFSFDILIPVIVSWSVMVFSALIVLAVSRMMEFSKEITGMLMLVAVLTNSSFLGLPIIQAYYGAEALAYIMVYDQLGVFLALATYGTFVSAFYSATTKITPSIIGYKIITFPPFIALIVALFLNGITFPASIELVLNSLSATVIPLALVAVGLQLEFKLPKDELKPFSVALFIKLFIAPLIAIAICYIFAWDNLASKVSILEAAMAPMITAAAMASMAGLSPRLSSAIVGYGVIFSFFTSYLFYLLIL